MLVLHFSHYTEQYMTVNEVWSGKLLCVYSTDPAAPKLTEATFLNPAIYCSPCVPYTQMSGREWLGVISTLSPNT